MDIGKPQNARTAKKRLSPSEGKVDVAKDVIMPALGMAQETGTLIQWLKAAGDPVTKGEPLMEIETDKATVEIEAPASGILSSVSARPGDIIPVGQRIALILAPGEEATPPSQTYPVSTSQAAPLTVTPVAARLAAEHDIDISQIKPNTGQIRKEDVLAYIDRQKQPAATARILASPKARRLAKERSIDIATLKGSGPDGAILVVDLPVSDPTEQSVGAVEVPMSDAISVSRVWHVMVDRLSQAWTTIPHFYLMREVNASRLVAWREKIHNASAEKITYTDLLVKLTAVTLRKFPRLNASWQNNTIVLHPDINIGLAVAIEDGLVVPVLHYADELNLSQIGARRTEIVARAKAGKLSLDDLNGGTFTISNLGMYGVDAFNAIVNPPQAAILAVSRIADRVVPVKGQPAVQPMMTLSLSCDHRVVDGARGAEFLQALADLIEEPLQLLN